MSVSAREQLIAFIALICAILLLGIAPVVVAGLLGKTLPDSLIAVSDKSVSGLIGVLGAISTLIFRTNRNDEASTVNVGKMADAVTAAAKAGNTPDATQGADRVADAAANEADQVRDGA